MSPRCVSAIPQTHSFPFVSLQDNSLSHHTHPHPTFSAHYWLRMVISSNNQSSKSLGDEPIKEKVVLSSFLSPPAPFPNSLFLIGTGLFSATVTTETSVTIATVYVKSVALYLLKCSIYTRCVWWAAQYQHTHTHTGTETETKPEYTQTRAAERQAPPSVLFPHRGTSRRRK